MKLMERYLRKSVATMKNKNGLVRKNEEIERKITKMGKNWIIKCEKQSDYKKVVAALASQYIPSKTKIEEDEESGVKKIKCIKVSKKVVDCADTIFFILDNNGIDFALYEKEKGCKAEEVIQHSCEEMEL